MVKTSSLEVPSAGRSLEWMPVGRTVSLRPAGQWWDAVRVPREIALVALGGLSRNTGAVIEDPGGGTLYWLVPAGQAADWQMPEGARIAVLSEAAHLAVPGPQRTAGPHWRIPPTRSNALMDPGQLHDALARAAAVVAKEPPDEAYKALCAHYDECPGCAHDTAPCTHGRQLRQAWVAVRWS
ncbi:hypothetical protein [Streptomyces sp. NBC_00996]|uniref:hypothetical protein n=1 Tax=Streptomyces sp. NBC_00996 TaxID=2903710 RepID=UPI00386D5141|nr:hypothetical protein OG390_15390 [Streptomyces sp. NBC_00996]